jgi:rhamnosyl/mannosyltransferase
MLATSKRILYVVKSYFPTVGGIETTAKQLAEGAVAHGYKVSVLSCAEKSSIDEINGVMVYRRKPLTNVGSAPISLRYFFDLQKLMQKQDIIHFHVPNPMGELAYCFLKKEKTLKTLCTYHLDPVRPKLFVKLYKKLLHRFLTSCDIICPTSLNYVASSDILNTFKDKCQPVASSIDTAKFLDVDEDKKRQAELLVRHLRGPRVLFCGRFSYYKGLSFLVDAVSKIPECSLILAGGGEKREELEQQIENLNIKDRVVILGHLPEELYPAIYYTADVFVLPSIYRSEAFGLVGLEAMAAGLPIITTELGGGASYYNIDGETGYIVAPQDSEALAQAIRKIIDAPEKATKMAKVSRKRVQDFDVSMMIDKFMKIYVSLYGT